MKTKAVLACEICSSRNYTTSTDSDATERLVLKKFCKQCGKHTVHKETK